MLILAIVLITAALVLYTTGVWTERKAGVLKPVHAALFAAGLVFDSTGTFVMSRIASSGASGAGGVFTQVMQITGAVALVVMAAHLLWALIVLGRDRIQEKAIFHKLSLGVWALWLVPYITGAVGSAIH